MEKQSKLLTIGAGMASFAAILGGSVFMVQGSSASAASSGTSAHTSNVTDANQADATDRTAAQAAYIKALAAKLGISETQLTAALKAVQLDQIAQSVTDGKITQAQADEAIARINSGDVPLFGLGGRGHSGGERGGSLGRHVDRAALATFLGLDETALETALHSGKSMATVAGDQGKSRDQLKAFLTTELTATLSEAVTDGKMTQAQADARLAEATANLDARIDRVGGEGGSHQGGTGMTPPAGGRKAGHGSTTTTGS